MRSSLETIFVLCVLRHGAQAGHYINNNEGRRASSSSRSTANTYGALRQRNDQDFNNVAPIGNVEGCPVADLSFKCEFGEGIVGALQINRCQYFDPNPQTRADGRTYNCAHPMGYNATGYKCDFCCNRPNALVESCNLGVERSLANGEDPDRFMPPLPPNSKMHCIGRFKGNLCDQSTGDCGNYCCSFESSSPCITPLCPANGDNPFENRGVILRQCQYWQQKPMATRGTLRLDEWYTSGAAQRSS